MSMTCRSDEGLAERAQVNVMNARIRADKRDWRDRDQFDAEVTAECDRLVREHGGERPTVFTNRSDPRDGRAS